ncbi:hypothetical protein LNV09_19470 [Paucibacter sp. B2R-40]|uniref:hypothetical protein n=1 Tax=Paucibacter sp. B2R-40 TaxID=2893554 RepID=UPI0021E41EC4|nr:hypothetical protein [Paucibacter sp. B2R-40]MCV2356326.1 hypothetical protein [Paucibacter sp. B2R-40]
MAAITPNTEHLVLALHLHCVLIMLLPLLQLTRADYLGGLCLLLGFVYQTMTVKRVFGGPYWQHALKGLPLFVVHSYSVAITTLAVTLGPLLF